MRDRLIELIKNSSQYMREQDSLIERIADYLLENGVVVSNCKVRNTVYVPWVTNHAKLYSQVEQKITTIYKLSGMTLDEIIDKLAKGHEFVPSKQTNTSLETLIKGGKQE